MVGRDRRARCKRATSKRNERSRLRSATGRQAAANSESFREQTSQRRTQTPPIALTIAGSDCSAGAGVQADLKTFSSLGVYGLTAVTCVVAEIPGRVLRIEPASARIVREQIELLVKNFPIDAIKTGLLCSAE